MSRVVYRREDPDGTLRELHLPWWWPLFAWRLRIEALLTGVTADPERIDHATAWHGRWRIVPRYFR